MFAVSWPAFLCSANNYFIVTYILLSLDTAGLNPTSQSLEDLSASSEAFIINPWNGTVQYITSNPHAFTASVVNDAAATGDGGTSGTVAVRAQEGELVTEVISDHAAAAEAAVIDVAAVAKSKSKAKGGAEGSVLCVQRFGHTLTKVGAKSILLIGGASTDNSTVLGQADSGMCTSVLCLVCAVVVCRVPTLCTRVQHGAYFNSFITTLGHITENATHILDISMNAHGQYALGYRIAPIVATALHSSTRGADGASDATVVLPNTLPCQECRSHHTVHYDLRQSGNSRLVVDMVVLPSSFTWLI